MGCEKWFLKYLGIFAISSLCLHGAALSQVDGFALPNEIVGSITIHVCKIDPADLLVRARPVLSPHQLKEISGLSRRSQVVKTTPIGIPGTFAFRFDRLEEDTLYRLGLKLTGKSAKRCGKMVWTSSQDPLVFTGREAITFEAYPVRSQIEILGESGPNRAKRGWFGADALDFGDETEGIRQIRWRSDLPGINGGRLQVSLKPFPKIRHRAYNPCPVDGINGLVLEIDFNASPGQWSIIPVDFHTLLNEGSRDGGIDLRQPGITTIDDGSTGQRAISDLDWAAIDAGRPIHIRALPKIGDEILCDPDRGGIPPEVILAKILPSLISLQIGEPVFSIDKIYYNTPQFDSKHPKPGEICYRVTQEHFLFGGSTWDYALVQNSSQKMYTAVAEGFQFCIPNSYWNNGDDGWLESFANSFGSVLTAVVDATGKLINSASAFWEEIQDYATDSVVAGLDVLCNNCCNDTCRAALEMGVEIGLASIGVPPSLPNFNQVLDQGADYLAAQVGSQLGVPSVLTDYASNEAQKFIKAAVKDMKEKVYSVEGLPDWLVPDIRFVPGYLTLELYGSGVPLQSQPGILRAMDPIYTGRFVQLPRLLPKKGMSPPLLFPMTLDPNTFNLTPAPAQYNNYDAAIWDKEQWLQKRYSFGQFQGCYHLKLIGLAPEGDHIFDLADFSFRTGDGGACQW